MIFCSSPGTGMCWKQGHDPNLGPPATRLTPRQLTPPPYVPQLTPRLLFQANLLLLLASSQGQFWRNAKFSCAQVARARAARGVVPEGRMGRFDRGGDERASTTPFDRRPGVEQLALRLTRLARSSRRRVQSG